MVCEKCEKKLGRVITPDKWKDGARNTTESGRCACALSEVKLKLLQIVLPEAETLHVQRIELTI